MGWPVYDSNPLFNPNMLISYSVYVRLVGRVKNVIHRAPLCIIVWAYYQTFHKYPNKYLLKLFENVLRVFSNLEIIWLCKVNMLLDIQTDVTWQNFKLIIHESLTSLSNYNDRFFCNNIQIIISFPLSLHTILH